MKRRTFLLGATATALAVPVVRTGPIAAYGVVRMPCARPGAVPLMRVRRSDGTEADICAGPDGGLDTAALLAFVGSGSAWLVTPLDQAWGTSRWAT